MKKTKRPLSLSRETIAVLGTAHLARAAGGNAPDGTRGSVWECPSLVFTYCLTDTCGKITSALAC